MNPSNHSAGAIHLRAPAKINLFLEILGKRPDGYHEINTLMAPVDLCDELRFFPHEDGIALTTDATDLSAGPDNLVWKAAELLRQETGSGLGCRIELKKNIPWAAGLGGGSSDAATTLLGLNELWKLNLGRAELALLAARLGSDVPFFIEGTAAWCTGRGEILEPLAAKEELHLLLVWPPSGCSTAEVYRRLKPHDSPQPAEAMKQAFREGDWETVAENLFNRLQEAAIELNPDVASLLDCLKQTSTLGCLMSGSGSSAFALAVSAEHAEELAAEMITLPVPQRTRMATVKTITGGQSR